jgi:hypothetical protein
LYVEATASERRVRQSVPTTLLHGVLRALKPDTSMATNMIPLRNVVRGFALVAVTSIALACSNSKSSGSSPTDTGVFLNFCQLPQSCKDIAQACMPKDDGSKGTIHDCHLTGHETGTQSACDAVHDKCVQTCNAAPAFSDGPVEDLSAPCRADAGGSSP